MSVKGTTRNDFDTDLIRKLLCTDDEADFEIILGEACCVIDGLRKDMQIIKSAVRGIDTNRSFWAGPDGVPVVEESEVCLEPGTKVLINLNDEAGCDWYSVEAEDDVGNWLDSFDTLMDAFNFICDNKLVYDHPTGFRDTRTYRLHYL